MSEIEKYIAYGHLHRESTLDESGKRGRLRLVLYDDHLAAIREARERADTLATFARIAAEIAFEGNDFDGGSIQGELLKLGLIVEEPGGYDPDRHGEHDCEPGDTFYVYSALLSEGGS